MSTTSIPTLPFAARQIIIYSGIPVFIAGVLGGILNLIVFLSLQTFRQSSCAFYLTVMSFIDIIHLCLALLSNIITAIYNVDGTDLSLFYCKLRPFLFHICTISSMTCFCLATIDQYWATCTFPRLQQWCNIKFARRLLSICIFFCILHGVPYWIFFYHTQSPVTNKTICITTDPIYGQYRLYVNLFTLSGFLPITIAIIFGLLAYRNVQQIAYRTLPLVRRELDKQLTVMALVQVVVNCIAVLPYQIVNIFILNPNINNDLAFKTRIQMSFAVTLILSYVYFANPCYIYICTSERFRRQLIHVLCRIYFNRWKQPRMVNNQVTPHS